MVHVAQLYELSYPWPFLYAINEGRFSAINLAVK